MLNVSKMGDFETENKLTPAFPMKGILKNRNKRETDSEIQSDDDSRRFLSGSPNLITTGTGKGEPYGATQRPKTTGKRVQFNRLPKPCPSSSCTVDTLSSELKQGPCKGRRLYLDRSVSARILGSSSRAVTAYNNRLSNDGAVTVPLSVGDANIRSQISQFIRKLRLAEREKLTRSQTPIEKQLPDVSHRNIAQKLQKSRVYRSLPYRPDWQEYDLDLEQSQEPVLEQTVKVASPDMFSDTKSLAESESVSIGSFASGSGRQPERTESQSKARGKLFHRTPNASLHTKYRHITTNHVNRYAKRVSVVQRYPRKGPNKANNSMNFCDSKKTDQILGWLEEVRSAHAPGKMPVQTNVTE